MSSITGGLVLSAVIVVLGIIAAVAIIKRGAQRIHDAPGEDRRRLVWRVGLAVALVVEITLTVPPVAPFLTQGEIVAFVIDAVLIGIVALLPALASGFVTMLVLSRKQGVSLFGAARA